MFFLLVCFVLVCHIFARSELIDYNHQKIWPGLCNTGKQQSPLNINPNETKKKNFPALTFTGLDHITKMNITNIGNTVLAKVLHHVSVEGGPLTEVHELLQFHFHWPSEHTFAGKHFPVEVHLVFSPQTQKNITPEEKGKFAVIAVLCDLHVWDKSHNLDIVAHKLEKLDMVNKSMFIRMNIRRLLPKDFHHYFTYRGSLSTNPCTEGITWIVFKKTLAVTESEITTFKNLRSSKERFIGPNNRQSQELNGRIIYYSSASLYNIYACTLILLFFITML